ncbi:MAG: PAS domain S-box protein [Fidelibacterota bacterium]
MTKKRILIVEDERIIAEDLRVTLESFGYEVIDIISSGENAIKKAGETLPDLILMDMVLEGEMRGSEAAEIIHRKYDTPIIFLTAYADENTLNMAKASEPYGYLIKPFEERELQATIEMFFYKIDLEQKLESSELRLRSLFEKAHDGIIIIDEHKRILEINEVAIHISGYSRDELLKKEYQDILPDLDLHTIQDEKTKSHVVETFILSQNKDHIPVEISHSSYTVQNERFIMLVFRDISERIRNRKILERRDQILEAVGVVAERLLSSNQIDKAMNESLKHIGETTSADRCYIFKNVLNPQNELCMTLKYEWTHETIAPQLNNDLLQNLPYEVNADDVYAVLSQNKIYHKNARDFNEAEKIILGGQDIQSLVLVPISVDNAWWGFIGLDDCHEEKEWAPAEIEALKVVAGTIGAAIQNYNARINIQKSEDKYRLLVDSINDGIVISQNGEFIFYNKRFTEILGYEPEELQNINYRKIYSRRGLKILMERFEKRQLGEKVPDRYETYFLKKDGKEIDVEVNVSIIEYEGNPASFAVIRDITEQKEAINEILKLSRALEQSSSSIIITDIKSGIEYVNPRFTEITEYSKEDVLGKKMSYLKSGVNPEDTYQELWETIIQGENWYGELQNKRKDGTLFWEKVSISPIRDNHGQITHYVAIRDDITDQKQQEEELRESEEKLRAITDSASDGILMVDHKARIVFWNPSAEKIFGYTAEEILGKNFFHAVVPQKYKEKFDTESFNGKFPEEMLGSGFELNITRKDHKEIFLEASFSSVRLQGHWNTIAIIRDISERKQAEQEINMLAHAIKSISEAVSVTDLNDRIIFVNNAFIKTYGYTRDELIGKHISLIRTDEMMNDSVLLESIRNGTLDGGWQGEVLNRRKDGTVFPVMLSTSLLHDENGVPRASIGVARDISERKQSEKELYQSRERLNIILHSIGNGVVVIDSEDRVIIYNEKARELLNLSDPLEPIPHVRDMLIHCEQHGKVLLDSLDTGAFSNLEIIVTEPDHRILYVTGTTFEDVDGESAGKVFILRDVTKEREIDRMKTDFVSSVSHELRTPLTSIMGFSNTILRKEKMPEDMKKEFIEIIYNESKRLARLIEDVLSISKIESGKITFEMKPLNLDEVIQDAVTIYRTQAEDKQIELTYEKDEKLPEILGDRDAMSQVIVNLISNALKFTPTKGNIDVRLKHKDGQIVLDVEDNGMGIPKNEQDKIFQKFYRIHRPGTQIQGTGLGLSIVMEIIEKHKGKIEIFSEENMGSLFRISLPVFGN